MISLTRLNGEPIIINAAHIVYIEPMADTLVTLSTGEKLLVRQSEVEVIEKVTAFLRHLGDGPILLSVATQQKPEQGT
jgi:flagellar protein FlbD